jgi:hypothetical protein
MVKIFLILNLFYSYGLFAQEKIIDCNCQDEMCYIPLWAYKDTMIKVSKRDFLRKYISYYHSKDSYYVNLDTSNFEELYTIRRNDTILLFSKGIKFNKSNTYIRIKAIYEKRTLITTTPEYLPEDSTICFDVATRTDTTVNYGFPEFGEATYKFIKEMSLVTENDTLNISSNLFKDFINPNFMSQYYAITPVKVYYDKIKDYYAVYIYGSYDNPYHSYSYTGTYLCKIYIDLKRKKVGRIIMDGDYLTIYGLFDCLNFWMF